MTLFRQLVFAVGGTQFVVATITLAQCRGVKQLVIAVGQLNAAGIKLKALGERWIAVADAGQRGLGRGIVIHNCWSVDSQPRLNTGGEQIIENEIPIRTWRQSHARRDGQVAKWIKL